MDQMTRYLFWSIGPLVQMNFNRLNAEKLKQLGIFGPLVQLNLN
jgi:hypothetical protein